MNLKKRKEKKRKIDDCVFRQSHDTFTTHAVHSGLENLFHHSGDQSRRSQWSRRVRAHAASVRTLVTVKCALVILRSRQGNDSVAITKSHHRQLLTLEELLDHNLVACSAESLFSHDCLDSCDGLLGGFWQEHTLACRQPRCLLRI